MIKQILAAAAFAVALPAAAQQDFSKVEIRTEKLADGLYMLVGAGGNLGLSVGDDAVFLVDDQYAPMTPKILAAIKAITPKPVKFVLNTHWHGDHTGGNENLGKEGALIFAHHNVRKRMSTDQFLAAFNQNVKASPQGALPVVTFSADMSFHINGDEVQVFHVPNAHTDGDALVWFPKANVLHMGDNYFNPWYPFVDISSGGTPEGFVAALDRGLAIGNDQTKIIPGHGPLASKADMRAYRDMIATMIGRVKALLKDGKKVEEIVAAKPAADFEAKYGKGFIKADGFVEMLARNVGR